MSDALCILGRQPALGLAELESLYGADNLRPVADSAARLSLNPSEINFSRLGGTIKLCKILTALPHIEWSKIEDHLLKAAPEHASHLPQGKLKMGLSVYGLPVQPKMLLGTGLKLKKAIASSGRSVRVVPNKELALSSAQVIHNQLTRPLGWELVFIKDGRKTILAQTVEIQDIEAYAARDQKRPKRDARVGMQPPKLAQIIINLAIGQIDEGIAYRVKGVDKSNPSNSYTLSPSPYTLSVLDPFCGTGVVLQEALLMGYNAYGTDVDQRMIDFSKDNLDWLRGRKSKTLGTITLELGDATRYVWQHPFDTLAAETYLGRPFSSKPKPEVLEKVVADVNTIIKNFLKNVAAQTSPGFRLCLALPAWPAKTGFTHLPLLDYLTEMGYNRVSFVHAKNDDLIYHRENQVVGRELVVLQRT